MGTLKSNLILRGKIMTYIVDFVVHGHHEIEVEADNYEDAVSSAEEIMSMTDFGVLNYDVDAEVYAVEDEDGNTRYEF